MAIIRLQQSAPKQQKPLKKSRELRAVYRRQKWSLKTKDKYSKTYKRRHAFIQYLRRLHAKDRPELSDFAFVRIEQREVLSGPWTEMDVRKDGR